MTYIGLTHNFSTLQWCESYIHSNEIVVRILNCDLLLGQQYAV